VSGKIVLRADRLKTLREKNGWSQRELSRRCGFGESAIRFYEREEVDATASHVRIIAEQLGVSTDYLLGLSDDPQGPVDRRELSDDERTILEAFRRDSWPGVLRVVTDHITG
jgi:transcriptional regulator with XRE-family HTH domain